MNRHYMKYACCLMVFLFGCSTASNQRADRVEGILNKRLEKRLDDLSGAITLMINDANRLHIDVEDAKAAHSATQRKMEELEASFRNLCEQIAGRSVSAQTGEGGLPPAKETAVKPQLPDAGIAIPATTTEQAGKPEAATQTMVDVDKLLPVAQGFWDALNARDVQAARSFATRESGASIHIKDAEGPDAKKCAVSFGNVKIEGDKAVIETSLQTQGEPAIPMQTILVQEDGQWKIDASQTMMSVFGGMMGEMVKGLGKALEEGLKEMGKSMVEGLQKGAQETVQTSDGAPDAIPLKQEPPAPDVTSESSGTGVSQKAVTETTHQDKPASEDVPQQKQEASAPRVINEQAMPEDAQTITPKSPLPAGAKQETVPPEEGASAVAVTVPPQAKDVQKAPQEAATKPTETIPPKQESVPADAASMQPKPKDAPLETKPVVEQPKQETTAAGDANDPAKRESYLKGNVARLAEEGFPGKKGIQWNLIGFEHKAHMTYVEVEPSPAELEHPRYKFIVSFKDPAAPRLIGMMCLKDGQYVLYSAKRK